MNTIREQSRRILAFFLTFTVLANTSAPLAYANETAIATGSAESAATESALLENPPVTPVVIQPGAQATQSGAPLPLDMITPSPVVSQTSAGIRRPARVRKLAKEQYVATEPIVITVESDDPESISVLTVGPKGKVKLPITRKRAGNVVELAIEPPVGFIPGKYTVTVTDSFGDETTENFLWGVLAINTSKSIYTKDEPVDVAIAVLDNAGHMVCDADVSLVVDHPSGQKTTLSTQDATIVVNKECKTHDVTDKPDYGAHLTASELGLHTMTLTAVTRNGTHTITDSFRVAESVPFSVERREATRIYPKNTYPVRLVIQANTDFTGTVVESVPREFTITPLDSVASYSAVRVGFAPLQQLSEDSIHLRYPFENSFRPTLQFGQAVEDALLKKQYESFGLLGHDGIDFALPEGTPVLAADSGQVSLAGDGAYGTTVVIQHPWGRTYYGHLSQPTVAKGAYVLSGQQIGYSGSTGLSTGPHLHFGIRPRKHDMNNGYYGKTDPTDYLGSVSTESDAEHMLISWDVNLKKGDTITLGYQYNAPMVSPQLYFSGPLKFVRGMDVLGETTATPSAELLMDPDEDIRATESGIPSVSASQVVFEEARQWQIAADATFAMQTGYYVGSGTDDRAITGVGFSPDLVLLKDDTANGADGVHFVTTSFTAGTDGIIGDPDGNTASNAIQSLDSDGFTLGTDTDVNEANIRYTYMAFDGSDCTSSGTFCVGQYTGDGNATQALTSVGFQPDLVVIKRAGASQAVFRTSSMGTNVGQYFSNANEDTTGILFTTLDATGFTVGNDAAVNTNAETYNFFAFKTVTNYMAVGTFTGNNANGRAITAPGFQPDAVWIKNSNATTPIQAYYSLTDSDEDTASAFFDGNNSATVIQSLDATGFTVGATGASNENLKTIYWIAFAGATDPTGSGTYSMAVGTYTGTGSSLSVSSLGFSPDLVIIKDDTSANYAVYRTRLMKGDMTVYLATSLSSFTGGITSLDSTGFTVGTSLIVNTSGNTYHYQAFGGAFNPETKTGAADFLIGAYTGNGQDNRSIQRQPFQPDFILSRRTGSFNPVYRTSDMSGDLSSMLNNNAEAADDIQAINAGGFEIGKSTRVNVANQINFFFTFKAGTNMKVGNYTGSASTQNITSPGIQPDLVWVKNTGAVQGVYYPSSLSGDNTFYFVNNADTTDRITGLIANGFSVGGNQTETNTSATTYRYVAWKIPVSASSPTNDQLMRHGNWFNNGVEQSFTF